MKYLSTFLLIITVLNDPYVWYWLIYSERSLSDLDEESIFFSMNDVRSQQEALGAVVSKGKTLPPTDPVLSFNSLDVWTLHG